MKFRHLALLSTLICLALLGSHVVQASVPAEDYWQSMWPNTAMPKALADLTQPGGRTHAKIGHTKIDVDVYANFKETNLKDVTFFFEHELHPGKKVNLEFTKPSHEFTFLPDTVARTTPFSSTKVPEILKRFNIEPDSTDAERVKFTLELCESPAIDGEGKYCATSLESLVNFAVSKLGKNIRLLSTGLGKQEEETVQKKQEYDVVEGVKKCGDKAVVCHKLNYPYAVFYCHKVDTRAYAVPLVATGGNGTKVKALAVCHIDNRNWASDNPAFQQLNVKPGTVPVCHFLAADTLLWVPN